MPQIVYARKLGKRDPHVKLSSQVENLIEIFPHLNFENPREFSPKWQLGEEEVFFIDLSGEENLSFMEIYLNSIASSADLNVITKQDFPKISAIYTSKELSEGIHEIKFQRIWNKYYFKKGFLKFDDDECKIYNNDSMVVLTGRTDACWKGDEKRLYFKKFKDIKSIFEGIDRFYREATKEDLDNFSNVGLIKLNKDTAYGQRALKKIAIMLDDEIFENKNLEQLRAYANRYEQPFPTVEDKKICISSNEDVEILYKVVNEMFYTAEICNEKREINSFAKIAV